jgi:hypothetical protein
MRKVVNQGGFAPLATIIVIAVIVTVIGGAFYVGKQSSSSPAINTAANVPKETNTSSSNTDPDNWKTFEDKRAGITFKYPPDWKNTISKDGTLPNDNKGEFLSGTVTSPSGKVTLSYINYIVGLGGGSCPDAFPCPTVNVLNIQDVSGVKSGKVKLVEKITYWKGNGDNYTASFGLDQLDPAYPIKLGSYKGNDFYLTTNFTNDGGYFAHIFQPDARPEDGFKTYEEAKTFLDSSEAKIAKQILLSTVQL